MGMQFEARMRGLAAAAAAVAALGLGVAGAGAPAGAHPEGSRASAEERLGTVIQRAIRQGGPFFTAEERAVVERKCGYPAGSWDGFEANISDGVFRCTNGRHVDDEEMRAVIAAAGPRIGARVSAVMSSPEVRQAIEEVTRRATAEALAPIDHAAIARQAAAEARRAIEEARPGIEAATRAAMEEASVSIEQARRDAERARDHARRERRRR